MSNRIDNQNQDRYNENVQQERRTEDIRKQSIDKTRQETFQSAMQSNKTASEKAQVSQSQFQKSIKQGEAKESSEAKKHIPEERASESENVTKGNETTATSGTAQTGQTQKQRAKDLDSKKESIKEGDKKSKEESVKQDLAYEKAITGKDSNQQNSDTGENQSDDFFQQAVALVAPGAKTEQTGASKKALIPQEILDQIVSQVDVGVNAKGLTQMTVELKGSILNGASMNISAKNGKVFISFSGLDKESKALLKSSRKALADKLSAKHLTLAELDLN